MKWNINCRKVILFVNGIAFIALILSTLALNDIYNRNETNLYREWNVLPITFIWIFISILVNTLFVRKISKKY